MKTLILNCEGNTSDDLLIALTEIIRLIKEGFTSGFNGNESSNFNFTIKESICNPVK